LCDELPLNKKDEPDAEAELDRDIRRAKTILSLDKSLNKVDRFLKTNRPQMGWGKRSKEVKSNITDNESAKMTTGKGTIQGYNKPSLLCRTTSVVYDPAQPTNELHGLDEAPGGQPSGQAHLQSPDVGGGTGVWKHRHRKATEPVQSSG